MKMLLLDGGGSACLSDRREKEEKLWAKVVLLRLRRGGVWLGGAYDEVPRWS